MLPKAHLTSHSRMSGFRWVITPSWLSELWWSFLYSSSFESLRCKFSFFLVSLSFLYHFQGNFLNHTNHLCFSLWELFSPPRWLSGKESACWAGDTGYIPGSGRSPGEGNGNPLQYSLFFFNFYFFVSWRLIALQYCSGFCHTLKWISHGFTCVPHPNPPSDHPLHPIPLGLPSAPGPSTCLMHPTWAGDLFHPR